VDRKKDLIKMKIEMDDNVSETIASIVFFLSIIIIVTIISNYDINKTAMENNYIQTVKDNKVIWIKGE